MKLKTFIAKNNLKINSKVLTLCDSGSKIMKNSVDQIHDLSHVEKLLDELDYLINQISNLKKQINYEVLLLAICWHDTWNTNKKITNLFQLITYQVFEGFGSANLFKKYATQVNLDKHILRKTYYCIRKHSSFQIIPPLSVEAKILIDLDKLELWNFFRFFRGKSAYQSNKAVFDKYLVRLYYFYSSKVGMYFKTLEKNFSEKTLDFWQRLKSVSKNRLNS